MKKLILFLIMMLNYARYSDAQIKDESNSSFKLVIPESEGFSSKRLGRIDSVFNLYVANKWSAGAIGLVAMNGKIVYYKAAGYDDIDTKAPLKKDAIFRIASQTKAITSVAVMMLYEQGKFLLDDPVSKYIPEFKNARVVDSFNDKDSSFTTVKAKREITIRDLLAHLSGIGYPAIGTPAMNYLYSKHKIVGAVTTEKVLLAEEMKKLGHVPLGSQPGEKWTYGLSVDVLGYLVEVVSGMSLDKFFQERIFKPLRMNDTYFFLPKDKENRLMTLYSEDTLKNLTIPKKSGNFDPDYPKSQGTYYSGGGGLSSTAYDYSLFLQMLVNDGQFNGKQFLSKSTIRMMATNQIADLKCGSLFIPEGGDKFGLGFEVISSPGCKQVPIPEGSYGWGGTFGSLYWVDPVNKITAQLVLQKAPNSYENLRAKFIALVYQALVK